MLFIYYIDVSGRTKRPFYDSLARWRGAVMTILTTLHFPARPDWVARARMLARDRISASRLLGTWLLTPVPTMSLSLTAQSDGAEGAGQQTYLNAMALGKVVIVTEAPGVRDHIDDGLTGVVVPPADPVALAEALAWATDPANSGACRDIGLRAPLCVRLM